jgi:hypothetical protein
LPLMPLARDLDAVPIAIGIHTHPTRHRVNGLWRANLAIIPTARTRHGGGRHGLVELGGEGAEVVGSVIGDVGDAEVVFA